MWSGNVLWVFWCTAVLGGQYLTY